MPESNNRYHLPDNLAAMSFSDRSGGVTVVFSEGRGLAVRAECYTSGNRDSAEAIAYALSKADALHALGVSSAQPGSPRWLSFIQASRALAPERQPRNTRSLEPEDRSQQTTQRPASQARVYPLIDTPRGGLEIIEESFAAKVAARKRASSQ